MMSYLWILLLGSLLASHGAAEDGGMQNDPKATETDGDKGVEKVTEPVMENNQPTMESKTEPPNGSDTTENNVEGSGTTGSDQMTTSTTVAAPLGDENKQDDEITEVTSAETRKVFSEDSKGSDQMTTSTTVAAPLGDENKQDDEIAEVTSAETRKVLSEASEEVTGSDQMTTSTTTAAPLEDENKQDDEIDEVTSAETRKVFSEDSKGSDQMTTSTTTAAPLEDETEQDNETTTKVASAETRKVFSEDSKASDQLATSTTIPTRSGEQTGPVVVTEIAMKRVPGLRSSFPNPTKSQSFFVGQASNSNGNNPDSQKSGSGALAGILSGIILSAVGAVSGYFAYQKKKLCFKQADPEAPQKTDAPEVKSDDPQVCSTLLNSPEK